MVQPSLRDFIAFHDEFPSDESLGYVHDVPLGRCGRNDVLPKTVLLVSIRTRVL